MASPPKLLTAPATPPNNKGASSGEHTPTSDDTFRARGFNFLHHSHNGQDDEQDTGDAAALGSSWWGERTKEGYRPWHNPPRRRKTIPPDQEVAYERTKAAVQRATAAFVDTAIDVGREGLSLAADALEFAPVMGLAEAARLLLNIWQSVEAVETNRLSSLRLTERCATILYSIRAEIDAAGPDVAETLHDPVNKLLDAFRRVEHFVQKQVSRPFLKRYLKRDEDARKIAVCDASLTDCVSLFSLAIQIRMLKEIHDQGHHAAQAMIPAQPGPNDVLMAIATIRAAQAAHDSASDVADLYAAMRGALRMGSDVAILDVLQINRGEIQDAMKTLQRALEEPRVAVGPGAQAKAFPAIEGPKAAEGLGLTTVVDPATPSSSSSGSQYVWAPTAGAQAWGATPTSTPAAWDPEQDAAFHREFLESGLDALRRLSNSGGGESLPPWTITRWEVDREGKIGVGFFSDVYKGVWRGRQVAIKILAPTAPRKVFRHETAIWASLKHMHVLELLGASSATGDPPWFFVSPYMKNGTLVSFLQAETVDKRGRSRAYPGPLQMMHEVAVGMAYLHRKGVLHGDLKANNVLIDDDFHCVISDFGQSELRSEVYRLSHRPHPHGTLRWQAPEILSGDSVMTPEVDVYAFAIVCVEILTNGELPWPLLDDQAVQQLVLRHNKRPKIPLRPETSLSLVSLIEECWSTDPLSRPLFDSVARGLGVLVGGLRASKLSPSPRGRVLDLIREKERKRSPDMAPVELPDVSVPEPMQDMRPKPGTLSLRRGAESPSALSPSSIPLQHIVTPGGADGQLQDEYMPRADDEQHGEDAADPHPESRALSRNASSIFTSTHESESPSEAGYHDVAWDGYESPPPRDTHIAARRNERRYRLLLQHDFHPTLNLPLWEPSPVRLGAVGYLSKPTGHFVTFFNSFNPSGSSDSRVHALPSIYGYGSVREATSRQDRRNFAQIGIDIIQGLLTFKKGGVVDSTFSRSVKKRYSFPLRAGHKHAYLCTENTAYRYLVDLEVAKVWFKSNVKEIVRLFGKEHNIQREDVYLVIGTLETRDYGLFVSHEHPDGQVHFNVFTDRREGQDWGAFSTDTGVTPMPGPQYNGDSPVLNSVHATKISRVRASSDPDADAVLLARLRFKPDEDEPTRL
ncbi:hypothetical protein K439DRAFT_1653139 [Ramaria rubella]|nr:hypothetical protein K439DRAFT_1653139 [Ramaria rubella]